MGFFFVCFCCRFYSEEGRMKNEMRNQLVMKHMRKKSKNKVIWMLYERISSGLCLFFKTKKILIVKYSWKKQDNKG